MFAFLEVNMNYDAAIRVQSSINVNNSEELSRSMNFLKVQSELKHLQEAIMPLYDPKHMKYVIEDLNVTTKIISEKLSTILNDSYTIQINELQYMTKRLCKVIMKASINGGLKNFSDSIKTIISGLGNYNILYIPYSESDKGNVEDEKINTEIISEIFSSDQEEKNNQKESAIITLSPINERVLMYLSENPEAFYQLSGTEFEIVMAEIYSKLGYKVERTQSTRDGGKDIIIRKPEILGDFIYYVECKKYSIKRPIGVGIIRSLAGTIDADRVNGGILATTSVFSPDAKKFISENKYNYRIQMHDYGVIRALLNKVI